MRIRRLSIDNLASLRGRQTDIDLVAPPLGDAGLIAVTGPTGAGKTTLFDAVCLALFDETPRTRGRGRDPRDLLARGAGHAAVELELELDDGSSWRAEWSVHRARAQADGQLQAARLRIVDLITGVVLAEGKKQVQALVDRSLGLSFEQFTSVVLIAQGQFAKFLEATDAERSALLERLTGTEIYSELSRAAYERARAAQEKVAELEAVGRHFEGLSAEQVEELESALVAAEADLAARRGEVRELELAARRLGELLERRARQQEARRQLDEALAARAAAAPAEESRRRALVAALALPALERLYDARRSAVQAAGEKESCATAAAAAAAALAETRQALLRRWRELLERRAAAERTFAELSAAAALDGDTLEDLRGLWRGRQRTRELLVQRQREGGEAQQELDSAIGENFEAAESRHRAFARIGPLESALRQLEDALAELTEGRSREDWARRRVELQQAAAIAAELGKLDLRALEKEELQRRKQEAAAAQALERCRGALAAARQEREQQEALLRLAARQADLAEHRPQLSEGEPCPLCGATDHPWRDRQLAEDQGVLRRAEADRDRKREEERAAEKAAAAAAEAHQAAQLAVARAHTQRENAEQQIKSARSRWLELRLQLGELPVEALGYATDEPARIHDRLTELDRRLPQVAKARQALQAAEKELSAAETRQTIVGERLHTAESRRSEAAGALAAAAEEDRRAEQLFLDCAAEVAGKAGVAPPGNEKALELIGRLEARLQAYRMAGERRERLAALEERIRRRRPEIAAGGLVASGEPASEEPAAEEPAAGMPPPAALEEALAAALDAEDAGQSRWQLWEDRRLRAAAEEEERGRQLAAAGEAFEAALAAQGFAGEAELRDALLPEGELAALGRRLENLAREQERREERLLGAEQELREAAAKAGVDLAADDPAERKESGDTALAAAKQSETEAGARGIELRSRLKLEEERRSQRESRAAELREAKEKLDLAARLNALIGQKDGGKFRRFAQRLNLDLMLELANLRLDRLAPRYQLARLGESLDLEVIDREMADERRPVTTLSGGESFLVSLALALALADLRRGSLRLGTLFLDEGFGSLDEDTLDTALSVLEQLQADQNTQILIVSHVGALKERIDHRIDVQKLGGGRSRLQILGG